MLKRKQINNAAFKGMEKQTYSRTRIDTLEESLSTLKSIKDQFKVNEAQTRTTKNNSKKFTAKDVKQHKMELKADELTEYNVYIKYISYVEMAKKDNISVEFLEEMRKTSIVKKASENSGTTIELSDGELVRVYGHTNHETIKVKGMRHIRGELKRFLKSIFEMPYVLKADIIHVVVNKMMLDEAQYRWLGGVRKEKISEDVKYFKAWNAAGFTYHKYDLDINDETPHECVPNALFKMYGNRENKGFLASISDGGLEYVRNKLDGYVMHSNNGLDDDLDFGLDEHDQKPGYTSEQILKFCNEHKLRCYGYDWKMQQFITNKHSDIKFNNQDLPAFVFYLNDQHVYLIQDKEMRHALLHSNDKSDIISLLAKEQDKTNEGKERTIEVDLPFNMWDTVSDTTIFITQNRVVHDIFYKLACEGEVYNKKLKMNEKEGIVRFMYKTNTIIYNPDYHAVNTTIARLGEKYTFKNQRLNSLAKEYFEKEFGGITESTMNKQGDEIFHSDAIRNCMFNGWLSQPDDKTKLEAWDYNKHYTDCLQGAGVKYGWCIYNVFDEVLPYNGVIKAGYFFVETLNIFPFRGNGWYEADLVDFGREQGIITDTDIKFMYCAEKVLPPDHFKLFVKGVYETFEKPKDAINKFNGCLGHDYKNKNVHHFTTDPRNVLTELAENEDAKLKYVYADEFTSEGSNDTPINLNDRTLSMKKFVSLDKPACFHLYNDKRIKLFHNSLPLFYKIYSVSAVKMYKMSQQIGGVVRAILTDTIVFEGAVNKPVWGAEIGEIRTTNVKPCTHMLNKTPRAETYTLNKTLLTAIAEFKLEHKKGCFMTGMGGTGKSYTINQLKAQLQPHEYRVCTPTLKSALVIDGPTIYSLFNINPHDHTYVKSTVDKMKKDGVEWIFIDEISMINSKVWAILRDIKIIYGFKFFLSGDFGQLPPVEDVKYNVRESQVFKELCDGQILELTRNYRAEKCPEFKKFNNDLLDVRASIPIKYSNYGKKVCRRSLCWTNKTRKAVNAEQMLKEAEGKQCYLINNMKVFVGLPLIANLTRSYGEKKNQAVVNNEEFTVTNITQKTVELTNERCSLTLPHSLLKGFDLAYCLTVHKAQGSTYDFPYSIYEYKRFDEKMLYTAMSRATQMRNVNFVNRYYTARTGYIYKITSPVGKIYIGSTTTSIEQRFKEHQDSKDNSPLHRDMQTGDDTWTIEVVDTIEFIDEQEVLIAEATHIMGHDSITHGYNTKFPIDFHNIY